MDAVLDELRPEYLKAFGLTIRLFVVSGIASLVLGTILAALRVGPVSVLRQGGGALRHARPQHPAADDLRLHLHRDAGARATTSRSSRTSRSRATTSRPSSSAPASALTLYTSAFVCEAMRSGVNAVPLGQAEAAPRDRPHLRRQSMTPGRPAPGLRAPSVPPLTSVHDRAAQEHLRGGGLRRRSRPTATDARLHQRQRRRADRDLPRLRDRLHHPRRGHLAVVLPRRATVEGGPMSASSSSTRPVPGRSPGTASTPSSASPRWSRWSPSPSGGSTTPASSSTTCGSRSSPPSYVECILVDGLLETLKMAFFAIIFAVVFGLVFGVGKLSDHGWVRWPAGSSWSSSAPSRSCC